MLSFSTNQNVQFLYSPLEIMLNGYIMKSQRDQLPVAW